MTNQRIEQAIALLSTKHEPVDADKLVAMALEGKRPHGQALMVTALSATRRIAELEAIIDEQRAAAEAKVAQVVGDWQASDKALSEEIAGLTTQVQNLVGTLEPWRPWAVSLVHHEEAPASAYLDGTTDDELRRLVAGELARRVRAANELLASLPPGSTVIGYEGDGNDDDEGARWLVHVWKSEPPFPPEGEGINVQILPWCYRFDLNGEITEQGRAATWGDVFEALGGELSDPELGDECVITFAAPDDTPPEHDIRLAAEAHSRSPLGVARTQGPIARMAEGLALSHAAELLEKVG